MAGLGERRVVPLDVPQATISLAFPASPARTRTSSGLRAEPYPRRRRLLLAALPGGPREAGPRLFRFLRHRRPGRGRDGHRRNLDAQRPRRREPLRHHRRAEAHGTDGPTAIELEQAKRYLIGSWALRFETSIQIASNLIRIQLDGLGIDYLDQRNALIEAVSLDDVRGWRGASSPIRGCWWWWSASRGDVSRGSHQGRCRSTVLTRAGVQRSRPQHGMPRRFSAAAVASWREPDRTMSETSGWSAST